jgi:hypothetical protein
VYSDFKSLVAGASRATCLIDWSLVERASETSSVLEEEDWAGSICDVIKSSSSLLSNAILFASNFSSLAKSMDNLKNFVSVLHNL